MASSTCKWTKCIYDFLVNGGTNGTLIVCDDNGPFIRIISVNNGIATFTDFDLDGNPYVPVGAVVDCDDSNLTVIATVALNAINLIPSATPNNDERLTVDATAGGVQTGIALAADTTHIFWRLEAGSARLTIDDSAPIGSLNPATGNGHIVRANDSGVWRIETWSAAKWIRNTGQDGVIQASQMRPVV